MMAIYKNDPDNALQRCSTILEMTDWMPFLTDNDGTKYFPEKIYEQVTNINYKAGLRLLKHYLKNKAKWQVQNCLEILINYIDDADPEVLWALTALFANFITS